MWPSSIPRCSRNSVSRNGFKTAGCPEYQIEIHLGGQDELALADLDAALLHAQALLSPGVA